MNTYRWGKFCLALVIFMSVVLSLSTFTYAEELGKVQKAITDQGRHWIAEKTENSMVPAYAPEYAKGRRIGLIKQKLTGTEPVLSLSTSTTTLPAAFDWSAGGSFYNGKNYVTPVRNQGNCGSCWAFATTAALESYTLIQGGDSTCSIGACDLSEQMTLTCSGGGSCNGGGLATPSNYFRDTGLATESCDPYSPTATACSVCNYWSTQAHKIKSWAYVATYSPTVTALKNALVLTGPLVTTMAVYQDFYLYYRSGVYSYTSGSCVGYHAVVIVGYQDDSAYPGGGYFRVKNSWGTNWGETGFFRIAYSELSSVVNFGDSTIAYQSGTSSSVPSAPTSLSTNAISSSQINLAWADNAFNEDGFKVERCAGSGCTSFAQIATIGANVTSYSNTGLQANTPYTYRVCAFNVAGNSAYTNAANSTTLPPPPPPNAPSGLVATVQSRTQIDLSWVDNSTNETGFSIERCTGMNCTNFSQVASVGANTKKYIDKALKKGTTYSYRVSAYHSAGRSSYSNTAIGTTPN